MRALAWLTVLLLAAAGGAQDTRPIVVGSKTFTESRILGEIVAQLLEARAGLPVERRLGLGGTLICHEALRSGEIDVYPEYTGTAWSIVLEEPGRVADPLRCYLTVAQRYERELGLVWLPPFGLNNTYAIAVRAEVAEELGLRTISDLARHADRLRAGFSHEFMNREDGWLGMLASYGEMPFADIRGMEHGLAYAAIGSGVIDVIDAYGTDGKLLEYDVRILDDDRALFPPYHAAPVFRQDALARHPRIRDALAPIAFRLDDARIQRMNHDVEEGGWSFAEVARTFLVEERLLEGGAPRSPATRRSDRSFIGVMVERAPVTLRLGWQHVQLTAAAVLLAALLAIPLGIWAARSPAVRRLSLGAAGVVQTIPSLALLAFLIPVPGFGLGVTSAIAALFLYAMLPILRNTYTGIVEVDRDLLEAARGIGLTERQMLSKVQLPLASRTILAGVRTAAVVSVGIATLAAFIGAGGLGEPIVTGLQLNDTNLILSGAVPAAALALMVDFLLGLAERRLTPEPPRS